MSACVVVCLPAWLYVCLCGCMSALECCTRVCLCGRMHVSKMRGCVDTRVDTRVLRRNLHVWCMWAGLTNACMSHTCMHVARQHVIHMHAWVNAGAGQCVCVCVSLVDYRCRASRCRVRACALLRSHTVKVLTCAPARTRAHTVKELKDALAKCGVDHSGAREKSELVHLARTHVLPAPYTPHSSGNQHVCILLSCTHMCMQAHVYSESERAKAKASDSRGRLSRAPARRVEATISAASALVNTKRVIRSNACLSVCRKICPSMSAKQTLSHTHCAHQYARTVLYTRIHACEYTCTCTLEHMQLT